MSPHALHVPDAATLARLLPGFDFGNLIACSGTGAVYHARQRSLDRDVAIKLIATTAPADPDFRARIMTGAAAMAKLSHPNLIRVFDSGENPGWIHLVMEFVEGKPLIHSSHGKAVDPKQAARIILAASRGLAHAHQHGMVHHQLSPSTILLNQDCEPKIGGFRQGLRGTDSLQADAYTAPELLRHPATGDARADIFSLGIILRELLTGVPTGSPEGGCKLIDPRLAKISARATHPDPASRFADASSLAQALQDWLAASTGPRILPATPVARSATPMAAPRPLNPPVPAANRGRGSSFASLMRNCAVIAALLGAIHFTWQAYEAKKQDVIRQQAEQDAKARMVKVIHIDTNGRATTTILNRDTRNAGSKGIQTLASTP